MVPSDPDSKTTAVPGLSAILQRVTLLCRPETTTPACWMSSPWTMLNWPVIRMPDLIVASSGFCAPMTIGAASVPCEAKVRDGPV